MYHPRLYGDFYNMGFKYGSLLFKSANFQLPEMDVKTKEFGVNCIPELGTYYPEVLEEINGFADGIEENPNNVAAFLLSLVASGFNGQCSVFAFKNDDAVIVGRNYDMPLAFKKFTESSLIAPSDKWAYIGQSDVFIGRSDGINEKGLFTAMSFVNGKTVRPGVSFHFIIRKVLENASSTEEAIELIKQAKVSSSNNFIVADAHGHIAVVESAPEQSRIINLTNGHRYLHITNQFMNKDMQAIDQGNLDWSKSMERYQGINQQLRTESNVNVKKAKEILSDACICLDLKKEKFGTIWSLVANLKTLEIERAESKPKVNNFKEEARLDWWLKKRNK
ncbi:C45 family peptidase [uncultured Croceitalea sp.]|uniref:C45 family peptidase n=1 Tax=uncultured Croceitalea sp. TaxID=1798908 RepID=UPI003305DFB9